MIFFKKHTHFFKISSKLLGLQGELSQKLLGPNRVKIVCTSKCIFSPESLETGIEGETNPVYIDRFGDLLDQVFKKFDKVPVPIRTLRLTIEVNFLGEVSSSSLSFSSFVLVLL